MESKRLAVSKSEDWLCSKTDWLRWKRRDIWIQISRKVPQNPSHVARGGERDIVRSTNFHFQFFTHSSYQPSLILDSSSLVDQVLVEWCSQQIIDSNHLPLLSFVVSLYLWESPSSNSDCWCWSAARSLQSQASCLDSRIWFSYVLMLILKCFWIP